MKNNVSHKIISFILTVSLLLPLGIGFSHALHNHEHNICVSKTEKHIHTQKIDCSYFHYFTNIQYQNGDSDSSIFVPNFISTKITLLTSSYFSSNTSTYLTRGPPTINIF